MLDFEKNRNEEGQAHYPDAIRFRSPRGFRESVKTAAQVEGLHQSEFIRRAVGKRIESLGVERCCRSALAYVVGV